MKNQDVNDSDTAAEKSNDAEKPNMPIERSRR
jgi:hypothetical protein